MKSKKLDFLIKHIDRKNHLGNFLKCLILYQIRYLIVKNILEKLKVMEQKFLHQHQGTDRNNEMLMKNNYSNKMNKNIIFHFKKLMNNKILQAILTQSNLKIIWYL